MRARLLVDYNEKFRKGDDAPADKAAHLVKVGLAEEIVEPAEARSDAPGRLNIDLKAQVDALTADLDAAKARPKRRAKAAK